jgi:26S proteasome regulatory subunit N8
MVLPEEVVVHPLVLLSVVDHYTRTCKDTKKRAVGVLLGSSFKGKCDITNSFAVPFEEDQRNPKIWYLDHNYLENMERMFRKINANERIVGFYSTGPKLKDCDIQIDHMFRKYSPDPVLVIIDVRPDQDSIPTKAYGSIEVQANDTIERAFKFISATVGAFEAEEVGVEHLLRDINDPSVSSLANQVKFKMSALSELKTKLLDLSAYLTNVLEGKIPVNNQILYNMQTMFNLLPNLNVESLVKSMSIKTNDYYMVIYVSALIRCVIALHNLVNNKIKYKDGDDEEGDSKDSKQTKDENDDAKKDEDKNGDAAKTKAEKK